MNRSRLLIVEVLIIITAFEFEEGEEGIEWELGFAPF